MICDVYLKGTSINLPLLRGTPLGPADGITRQEQVQEQVQGQQDA